MSLTHVMSRWPLWAQAEHGEFTGVDNIAIRYSILRHPDADAAVVISNGRIESYLKYWPLIEALYAQGVSVYLWDHRGQGLSQRMLANPHIGHVEQFEHYVEDMAQFYREHIAPDGHTRHWLLGHSMGGAIAALYLSRYPEHFERAAFSAPMFGICLPLPRPLLQPVVELCDRLRPQRYILGGHNYDPVPFECNKLTSDRTEYQQFRQLYRDCPAIQLGDPSNRWLKQALAACDRIRPERIQTPILVMQAGADSVVCNQAQTAFVQPPHRLHRFEHAKHELFIESAEIRSQVLTLLQQWFELPQQSAAARAAQ
ncbi:alpha/beta fold hydrolase [Ferrimonas pelagia]|uniref:Alpha/beta fold hydrolase n=1 Tax=Ferrimonas pelagia TaxID=1177826 RepID=A0ABP9EHM5_9GAMM